MGIMRLVRSGPRPAVMGEEGEKQVRTYWSGNISEMKRLLAPVTRGRVEQFSFLLFILSLLVLPFFLPSWLPRISSRFHSFTVY